MAEAERYHHTSSVFSNSCVKIPRHPCDKKPYPIHERELFKYLINDNNSPSLTPMMKTSKRESAATPIIEFFDSIPEYEDLNHLSNKEFYRQLNWLKEKQKTFFECVKKEIECESASSEDVTKPPSRRSVRIEERVETDNRPQVSPLQIDSFRSKSRGCCSSALSKYSFDESEVAITKSAPTSPRKVSWKNSPVTEKNEQPQKSPSAKSEMFRANPVPIESQIPLFNKIMLDQEIRRQKVKEKSKRELISQMRPFSFTKRDEELQELTRQLSKSTPSLLLLDEKPEKPKQFKAKPVPKNLFSNYVYERMHEDEFFRAIQKKIRSEELLKTAALPPAMEKREKTKPKQTVCPRSYRDYSGCSSSKKRTSRNIKLRDFEKDLAELELEYVLQTPSPKLSGTKSKKKRKSKRNRKSPLTDSTRSISTLESVNRSNLAAVLRYQSAKKRMQDEIARRFAEIKIREEARWKEKAMRKKPVWEDVLAYSHEEDLHMRLQLRRDEERLRQEEHKRRMQKMLGRVNMQPTLFERQSLNPHAARTREELIMQLYRKIGVHPKPHEHKCFENATKYSDSSARTVVEMKDEAVQAYFEELFADEENAAVNGEEELGADDETTENIEQPE